MQDLSKDWRLTNELNYLKGLNLSFKEYKKHTEGWEHDHCEFCGIKFSEDSTLKNSIQKGYSTQDNYHWICENCFNDFKALFAWKVR